MRGRLQGDRRVGLRLGRPPRHLARRPLPDLPGRRLAASSTTTDRRPSAPCWCAPATSSGPTSGTRSACAARRATSSRSPTIFVPPIIRSPATSSGRMPRERPALPHGRRHLLRGRLRRRGTAASPAARWTASSTWPGNKVPRGHEEPAPRQRRGADQPRPGRGQHPLGARLSCCSRWPASGNDLSAGDTLTVEQRITIRSGLDQRHPQGARGGRLRLQCRGRHRDLREPSAGAPLPRHPHRDPAAAGPALPLSKPSAPG